MPSKRIALFTIIQNEDFFLNIWLEYYKKYFPIEDIYVLNHNSTIESCLKILKSAKESGVNVIPVHRDFSFDHAWLRTTVENFQRFLLKSYDYVMFVEIDEIVAPDPSRYKLGIHQYILDAFNDSSVNVLRCVGFNVEHTPATEPDMDLNSSVLSQRSKWRRSYIYDKPLISNIPLEWVNGFHWLTTMKTPPVRPDLILIHLHKMDYGLCKKKHAESAKRKWSKYDIETLQGDHNRIDSGVEFEQFFFGGNRHQEVDNYLVDIPPHFKGVV
jgi:hypothetical protein